MDSNEVWSTQQYAAYLATQRGHGHHVVGEVSRHVQGRGVPCESPALGGEGHAVPLFPAEGISLVLPYPPSSNTLYPTGRDGRRHLSAAGREYHRQVRLELLTQWPRDIERPLHGRLAVLVEVYPPDRSRRDIANTEKIVMDSLTKAQVWQDDSQIDELQISRYMVAAVGYIAVRIEEKHP